MATVRKIVFGLSHKIIATVGALFSSYLVITIEGIKKILEFDRFFPILKLTLCYTSYTFDYKLLSFHNLLKLYENFIKV